MRISVMSPEKDAAFSPTRERTNKQHITDEKGFDDFFSESSGWKLYLYTYFQILFSVLC